MIERTKTNIFYRIWYGNGLYITLPKCDIRYCFNIITYINGINTTISKHVTDSIGISIITHIGTTIGIEVYSCKVATTIERIVSNSFDSSRDSNRSKACARLKRQNAYRFHRIRNRNRLYIRTTTEPTIRNHLDMATDVYGAYITIIKHRGHTIISTVPHIRAAVGIKVYGCKIATIIECVATNTFDSSGDGNRSETCTRCE